MRAVYDLQRCPPTFDVVSFLMSAEVERLRRKDTAIEHLDILPGPRGGFRADTLWPHSIEERKMLRDNIVVPMCKSLPSVLHVNVWDRRPKECEGHFGFGTYSMQFRFFVDAYRLGVRPLRPGGEVTKQPDLVTITLRESQHWEPRNSRLKEWLAAAREIKSLGYRVLFIRDTRLADISFKDFDCIRKASLDLDVRGGVYRAAYCNLGINNGPMWFAMASDAPVLMLKPTCEELGACYGAQWFKSCGVKPGEQFPNAPSHQRIAWQEDTVENIVAAFNEFRDVR